MQANDERGTAVEVIAIRFLLLMPTQGKEETPALRHLVTAGDGMETRL